MLMLMTLLIVLYALLPVLLFVLCLVLPWVVAIYGFFKGFLPKLSERIKSIGANKPSIIHHLLSLPAFAFSILIFNAHCNLSSSHQLKTHWTHIKRTTNASKSVQISTKAHHL